MVCRLSVRANGRMLGELVVEGSGRFHMRKYTKAVAMPLSSALAKTRRDPLESLSDPDREFERLRGSHTSACRMTDVDELPPSAIERVASGADIILTLVANEREIPINEWAHRIALIWDDDDNDAMSDLPSAKTCKRMEPRIVP